MRNRFNEDNAVAGCFGLAIFMWLVAVALSLSVVGGLIWVAYTIITKPEILANWIKVVSGG